MNPGNGRDPNIAQATTIILVRHGQSVSNAEGRIGGHAPFPLTALGRRQAEAAAGVIVRDIEPTALVSSDLVRARQTAEIIARATGLDIQSEPGFRERSLGVMDGLTFAEAEATYPDQWHGLRDPTTCPRGAERLADVYARVSTAIQVTVAGNPGGRVIVVSHGLAIFNAFAYLCGMGSPVAKRDVFMLVDNGSLSIVTRYPTYWRIETLNERGHLRIDR